MSIPDLFAETLQRDPARPLLTFYDHSSGERVELSRATTANWVAKTANMLQDSLAATTETTVAIDLPPHWERVVWMLAAWEVGCRVRIGAPDPADEVAVVGPDALDGDLPDADEVVALSLRPLGARFATPPPAGVIDYNAEVLGHGDHFRPYDPPTSDTPAIVLDEQARSHGACVDAGRRRAADWAVSEQPRVLTGGVMAGADVADILLGALTADGSLVVVAWPTHDRVEAVRADENVTVVDALLA